MSETCVKLMFGMLLLVLPFSGVGALYVAQLTGIVGIILPTETHEYNYADDHAVYETPGKVIRNGGKK